MWRAVAIVLLLGLFGLMFASHLGDLTETAQVLQRGQVDWLVVAVLLQLLWFANQAALYQSIYQLLGLQTGAVRLLPIVLASNFLNFVTPSASLGAVALFLEDARQQGLDPARVALASVVRLVLNLVWFSVLLIFALTVLSVRMQLVAEDVFAAALLLIAATLVIGGLALAGLRPSGLSTLLGSLGGALDSVCHAVLRRHVSIEERATLFGMQFGQAARALWSGRGRVPRPWLHVMLFDGLQLGVLYAVLRAFPADGAVLSPVTLLVIFTIGVLFSVVAVTPQGLGMVEVTLLGAFTMFGVSMGRAAVVVLAYRGFSFWAPLLVGLGALRWVHGVGRGLNSLGSEPAAGDRTTRARGKR
jgi:glycosyltransferase 2 family protein